MGIDVAWWCCSTRSCSVGRPWNELVSARCVVVAVPPLRQHRLRMQFVKLAQALDLHALARLGGAPVVVEAPNNSFFASHFFQCSFFFALQFFLHNMYFCIAIIFALHYLCLQCCRCNIRPVLVVLHHVLPHASWCVEWA